MSQLLRRLVVLQPGEAPALLASYATLLCTFSSYTILRPVRDALGITSGLEKIPYLFWGVFVVMLLLQPVYGWLTSRYPRTVFLPWVYGFFALNLVGFYAWFRLEADHTWIARTYFVWVSVFNLFVVAAFWSLMADVFTREQAGRVFGFIWAGASTGGLIGPLLTRELAVPLGAMNLLPISAALLLLSLVFMSQVIRWQHRHGAPGAAAAAGAAVPTRAEGALGGGMFAAFTQVVRSPYLLGIAVFVLLMTWVSTFLYLEQQAFVAKVFTSADQRARFFASIDLWVQAASLTLQFLLFGRLFKCGAQADAGRGAAHHDRGLRDFCPCTRLHGAGTGLCSAPRRRLRIHPAVPGCVIHGREPRGEVQGQEPDRHVRVSRRRCHQRLALPGAHRSARRRTIGSGLGGRGDLGAVDAARARTRQGAGRAWGSCFCGAGDRRRGLSHPDQAALGCAWPPVAERSGVTLPRSAVTAAMISAALAKRSPRDFAKSRPRNDS